MKHSKIVFVITFLFIFTIYSPYNFLFAEVITHASKILELNNSDKVYPLGLYLEYYEEENEKLTINEVSSDKFSSGFKQSTTEVPNFGFSTSSYWLRFTIKSNLKYYQEKLLLEWTYPIIDHIEFYKPVSGNKFKMVKTGDRLPFSHREVLHPNFIFKLTIRPGEKKTYYCRFNTESSVQAPIIVMTQLASMQRQKMSFLGYGIFYGIIIIMIVYNLFLYLIVKDKNYLFYIFYVCSYLLFQLALHGFSYQYFWPNSIWWANMCVPFFVAMTAFNAILFTLFFLDSKNIMPGFHKFLLVVLSICGFAIIFSLFGKYSTAIRFSTTLALLSPFIIFSAAAISMKRKFRAARFFMLAWSITLIGTSTFALKSMGIFPRIFLTEHAQEIGNIFLVVLLAFALGDKIKLITLERQKARKEAMAVQEKYKLIVEGSNDIIFTLDNDWNFITANKAIKTELRINPEKITTMNFLDIIYDGNKGMEVAKQAVREKLMSFMKTKEPISFKTEFKSFISAEPKEMRVRMEYLNTDGKNEIVGRASHILEDSLLKYFLSESQSLSIGNYMLTADEISYRLTRNLRKFLDSKEANLIRIALREILINSIEHGNLDITFEEKTDAMLKDEYFNFVAERQNDLQNRNKEIRVDYNVDSNKVMYTIRDEGEGFNFRNYIQNNSAPANEEMLEHGRGISMAMNVFDKVEYNEKGNSVVLIKDFV